MTGEIERFVTSVQRSVTTGQMGYTVGLTRHFDHPAAVIWQVIVDPDALADWFEPVEGELASGGRYRLTGSGTEGTIEQCEPGVALDLTWEYEGDVSAVRLRFTTTVETSTLTLEHDVPPGEHWDEYGPAATGVGWDSSFFALSLYLNPESASVAEDIAEFAESVGDQFFVTQSAEAWQAAHVAAGADPTIAAQAAIATIEFYTADE